MMTESAAPISSIALNLLIHSAQGGGPLAKYGLQLFGSHLTGLAHAGSDVDFIAYCEPDGFEEMKQTFAGLGFVDAIEVARKREERQKARGVFSEVQVSNSYVKNLNKRDDNLTGILKWKDPFGKLHDVDIVVAGREEYTKRLRTLSIIASLMKHDDHEDVEIFVKSLKSQHSAYRALHRIVAAAYKLGRTDELQDRDEDITQRVVHE